MLIVSDSLSLSPSHSDGSTETLSIAAVDEQDEVGSLLPLESEQASLRGSLHSDSSSPRDSLTTSDSRALEGLGDLAAMELDPESRSLSIDSAYGTLSPESLITELELKGAVEQSEGEETDAGEEEDAFDEDDADDDYDDADEEDSTAWNGSQVTVNESCILEDHPNLQGELVEEPEETEDLTNGPQDAGCRSLTLRRRSPVQPRPDYLQHFALRSRSEDDLLQRLTAPPHSGTTWSDRSSRSISKSLSQLSKQVLYSHDRPQVQQGRPIQNSPALSGEVMDTQRRAETRPVHRALSCPNGQVESGRTSPPGALVENLDMISLQEHHQHRKLTRAQLQRIRTTMVLNSTLTAS